MNGDGTHYSKSRRLIFGSARYDTRVCASVARERCATRDASLPVTSLLLGACLALRGCRGFIAFHPRKTRKGRAGTVIKQRINSRRWGIVYRTWV
jgi:hypothetical protein